MTTRQAPEIFQIPLDDLDPTGLPPRGTAEFEQAVIGRYALDYAARGWQAVVAVDDAFVRVVAVPERGVAPKAYVGSKPFPVEIDFSTYMTVAPVVAGDCRHQGALR